jgi:hypothetical protein
MEGVAVGRGVCASAEAMLPKKKKTIIRIGKILSGGNGRYE